MADVDTKPSGLGGESPQTTRADRFDRADFAARPLRTSQNRETTGQPQLFAVDTLAPFQSPATRPVAVLLVQLLPIVVVGVLYAGLLSIGVVSEGFGAMLFWVGAAAVSALVLYWVTSTLIALVVVTLPGMYPFRALRAASDLVVGWRLPILYRWLWGVAVLLLAWIIIMLPIILLDGWLKDTWQQLAIVPVVPVAIAVMMAVSVVWFATYVYLLYRKVVDDHARI